MIDSVNCGLKLILHMKRPFDMHLHYSGEYDVLNRVDKTLSHGLFFYCKTTSVILEWLKRLFDYIFINNYLDAPSFLFFDKTFVCLRVFLIAFWTDHFKFVALKNI